MKFDSDEWSTWSDQTSSYLFSNYVQCTLYTVQCTTVRILYSCFVIVYHFPKQNLCYKSVRTLKEIQIRFDRSVVYLIIVFDVRKKDHLAYCPKNTVLEQFFNGIFLHRKWRTSPLLPLAEFSVTAIFYVDSNDSFSKDAIPELKKKTIFERQTERWCWHLQYRTYIKLGIQFIIFYNYLWTIQSAERNIKPLAPVWRATYGGRGWLISGWESRDMWAIRAKYATLYRVKSGSQKLWQEIQLVNTKIKTKTKIRESIIEKSHVSMDTFRRGKGGGSTPFHSFWGCFY